MVETFPGALALVPHRGPALLLGGVERLTEDGITCWGTVPPDSPFAVEGRAPSFLALEMGAQAAAALAALRQGPTVAGGTPRIGYLVGIRDAHLGPDLPVGRRLRVRARPAGGAGPLAVYEVAVEADGVEFARGILSTYAA